jgi:2-iminobutanoate/2-iminopropanoate deaminase
VKRAIHTERAPAAIGPYSQAVVDEAGGWVFCSGQIGIDPASGEMASGGVEAEFRQILANVREVLAAASCTLDQVLKTTVYLADMGDFAAVNAIYAEAFREPFPARAAIQAAALPKNARVEMEVVARRPPG